MALNGIESFYILSLGCSKNLVDSEYTRGLLISGGLKECGNPADADLIIINTCGFILPAKEEAVETTLQAAGLKETGSLKNLIMTGCFSQRYRHQLKESMPEVDAFFGVNELNDLSEYIFQQRNNKVQRRLMTPDHYAYLKIAEGCSNRCSYCAIPLIRGPQISLSFDEIMKEAEFLASKNIRECLVIAQDTTTYGLDLKEGRRLSDILEALDAMKAFDWIRVHYMHPNHLDDRLIDVMANSASVLPYIDLPVQHSHTAMLKAMNRGSSGKQIRQLIDRFRKALPHACLRTTIMTGFPGETDEMFRDLLDFVKEIRFDRLGTFVFSMEEDTPAEKLIDDVPDKIKQQRLEMIMSAQQQISLEKNRELIGKTETILIDSYDNDNNDSYGRTYRDAPEIDNRIIIPDEQLTPGVFYHIKITDALDYDCIGEKISD